MEYADMILCNKTRTNTVIHKNYRLICESINIHIYCSIKINKLDDKHILKR